MATHSSGLTWRIPGPGEVLPEGEDDVMGDEEKEYFNNQDSQYEENRILDAPHLREEVFGRQGAGKEHRPDEQRFQESVPDAGEDNRHQQDGHNPIGYDQEPFHRPAQK